MYCFFIRAHNSKGKHFDINTFAADSIMLTMYKSAMDGKRLPERVEENFRSLNEMYLSFMDPNGEIILFELLQDDIKEVEAKLYFKAGSERRALVFQTGYGDDFTQGHWRFLKERPITDRFDFSKEYDVIFHESDDEIALAKYRKMYAENGMLEKGDIIDFKTGGKAIVTKAHHTPAQSISLHEQLHTATSLRITDFGYRKVASPKFNHWVKGIYSKKSKGIIRKKSIAKII